MTVDLDRAAARFLELAAQLQGQPVLRAQAVLDAMLAFYQEVRVAGCALEDEADALLLQWGAQPQSLLMEPTDLRVSPPVERYTREPRNYLAVTRQLRPGAEGAALHLAMRLVFDPAKGDEDSATLFIANPYEVNERLMEFEAEPFVQSQWELPAQRLIATVEESW